MSFKPAQTVVPIGHRMSGEDFSRYQTLEDTPLEYIKSQIHKQILLRSLADTTSEDALVWGPFNLEVYSASDVNNNICGSGGDEFCNEEEGKVCFRLQQEGDAAWLWHTQWLWSSMGMSSSSSGCGAVIEGQRAPSTPEGVMEFRFLNAHPSLDWIGMRTDTTPGTMTTSATTPSFQWQLIEETPLTDAPTPAPTPQPTASPQPTVKPTSKPSPQPTVTPTSGPIPTPIPAPTATHIPRPTIVSTSAPSAEEPATHEPTTARFVPDHSKLTTPGLAAGAIVGLVPAAVVIVCGVIVTTVMMSAKKRSKPSAESDASHRKGRKPNFDSIYNHEMEPVQLLIPLGEVQADIDQDEEEQAISEVSSHSPTIVMMNEDVL